MRTIQRALVDLGLKLAETSPQFVRPLIKESIVENERRDWGGGGGGGGNSSTAIICHCLTHQKCLFHASGDSGVMKRLMLKNYSYLGNYYHS